jgi:hypothetical protein
MPITALCLLHVAPNDPNIPARTALRVERLDDALLVHTGQDFAAEPEQLAAAVHALLGGALLGLHDDERGIFFLPDVAAPRARSYAGVIDEVGEGGLWAPPPSAAGGGLDALLGQMLGQDPRALLSAATAAARENPGALAAASAQLQGLLSNPQQLDAQVPGLSDMLKGSGIDFSAPALQQMAAGLQAQLERDPNALAALAEQLFAGHADEEEEDDDDEQG